LEKQVLIYGASQPADFYCGIDANDDNIPEGWLEMFVHGFVDKIMMSDIFCLSSDSITVTETNSKNAIKKDVETRSRSSSLASNNSGGSCSSGGGYYGAAGRMDPE
jgi:hypothetical protein